MSSKVVISHSERRRLALEADGKCGVCGDARLNKDRMKCDKCLARDYSRHRKTRTIRYENGLCVECGEIKKPDELNYRKCNKCRDHLNSYCKNRSLKLKMQAFEAYGGQVCSCCNETNLYMLTIDHINGNGNIHRRNVLGTKDSGVRFYYWLKKNNYPNDYRILCFNCNVGSFMNNGVCPHKQGSKNDVIKVGMKNYEGNSPDCASGKCNL